MEDVEAILVVAARAIDRVFVICRGGMRAAEEVEKCKGGLRKILLNVLDIIERNLRVGGMDGTQLPKVGQLL